jgi:ribonuclease P protein component
MLPKYARIKKEADFKRIYRRGSRLKGQFFDVFFLLTHRKWSRFGVVVTAKTISGAVLRNKNKRLIRSFIVISNACLSGCDLIVKLKRKIDAEVKEAAREDLAILLKRVKNAKDHQQNN